jgi:hypothetical protein
MGNSDTLPHDFTVLDWIGVAVVAVAAATLASFPLTIAPTWRGMLDEVGGGVPTFTALVLGLWWAPTLGLVAAGCVATAIGLREQVTLSRRRLFVVVGFVVALVGVGITIVGVYLPVLAMADAVKG